MLVAVLLVGVGTVSAQTTTATSSRAAARAALVAQRLQNIVNRANQEITRRIDALNALIAQGQRDAEGVGDRQEQSVVNYPDADHQHDQPAGEDCRGRE